MPMDPAAQPPMEEAGPAAKPQGKDPMALVQEVGEGLAQLGEMVSASGDEGDKQAAAQIMSLFTGLVEKLSGGGAEPQEEGPVPADPGMVSAQAGAKGQPMGPQSRM